MNYSTNKEQGSHLIIYQKYLELIYYTNDLVRKYPKSETFAIVKELKSALYAGFNMLMHAIKVYKTSEKLHYLSELDIQLDLLKVYVRLSYKYHYISMQNYTAWTTILTNICNMLGGWIQSCQKR